MSETLSQMKITEKLIKDMIKERLREIETPPDNELDIAADDMIAQALGDDVMTYVMGLPPQEKSEVLDLFIDALVAAHPELKDLKARV
jgi:hypothetical protein